MKLEIAFLIFGVSCVHKTPNRIEESLPITEKSLSRLEQEEFENPNNVCVKLALAKLHWCEGRRGMAVEAWLWVKKFSQNAQEKQAAEEFISSAKNSARATSSKLGCKTK